MHPTDSTSFLVVAAAIIKAFLFVFFLQFYFDVKNAYPYNCGHNKSASSFACNTWKNGLAFRLVRVRLIRAS
jgi:hypothetical protein